MEYLTGTEARRGESRDLLLGLTEGPLALPFERGVFRRALENDRGVN